MRIVVLPPQGVTLQPSSPWSSLLTGLQEAGHDIDRFGARDGTIDAVVTLNDQPAARNLQKEQQIPRARSVLIALEPKVTAPRMYTRATLNRYGHRFAPSPIWAERIGAEAFLWPQAFGITSSIAVDWKFAATMINAEKRSAVRGSLYGLRRDVIRFCDRHSVSLAVVGPGWRAPASRRAVEGAKAIARAVQAHQRPYLLEALGSPAIEPKCSLGTIEDKASAFALAPAAIVIENSRDYVSEKLFDAIAAGVAPIYVGPPLQRFKIASEVAVACTPDPSQIVQALSRVSEERRNELISAGREWLASQDAQRHGITRVLTDLGRSIGARLSL